VLPVPAERKQDLDKAFQVLEDWAQGLTLNDADIDKERGIVLEELRLGKGAGDRMQKVLMPKMYNGSRYAERLPIGKEDTLRSFKPEALRRFYRDWYRPDLMAVVAVGDIDPARLEQLIKRHFGGLKNPATAAPAQLRPDPAAHRHRSAGGHRQGSRAGLGPDPLPVRLQRARHHRRLPRAAGRRPVRGHAEPAPAELSQLPSPPFMGASSASGA
jgi:zinc protease